MILLDDFSAENLSAIKTNKQTNKLSVSLKKVYSIYLEVAVFLQRHPCETIGTWLKPD